ncbi:Putative ribonuclease H protein At1g65750 [Linum perenne]
MLWKNRNERIFEGKRSSVVGVTEKIKFWVHTTQSAVAEIQQLRNEQGKQKVNTPISWRAAPEPKVTLNTDGSVRRPSGEAIAGGVIRDYKGQVLAAFAANLGTCSISRAEITGIVLGLEKASEMGVRDIEVQ